MQNLSETELLALNRIANGDTNAKSIADDLGMSYSAVLRLRRQYDDSVAKGEGLDLLAVPALVPEDEAAPGELTELQQELIGKVKTQRDLLDKELYCAATALAARIRSMAATVELTSEVVELAKAISAMNDTFFKDTRPVLQNTNLNVTGEGAQVMYGDLLNDKPRNN